MQPIPSYSQADVVAHTPATSSNIKWWTHQGLIRPDVADTSGTGHHRRFSFLNLLETAIAVELNRYGVPIAAIREPLALIRFLAEHGRVDQPSSGVLVQGASAWDNLDRYFRGVPALAQPSDAMVKKVVETGFVDFDQLILWLKFWRQLVTPLYRDTLEFAGISYDATTNRSRFIVQPKKGDRVFQVERTALIVNLIPILNELEARTGDVLS